MPKRKLIYFAVMLAVLIIQISVLPVVFPRNFVPQIALMAVIAATIIFGFHEILPWVIIGGLLLDLASFSIIGQSVIVFVLLSYFVSFFSRRFLVENKTWGTLVMLSFVAVATIFQRFFILFSNTLGSQWKQTLLNWEKFFDAFLIEIIFNAVIFMILFLLLRKKNISSLKQIS
jgi:rod shape-determining protein MreD